MLRFAPSPYRELSIPELRVALVNYVVARQRGDEFLLRFADNQKSRDEGREEQIKRLLEKFAIHPDRELWQSEHLGRHQQLAVKLVETGHAFLCTCGTDTRCGGHCAEMAPDEIRRIRAERIPFTIRIRKPLEAVVFNDLVAGEIIVEPAEVDHFVLLRSDGTPTPLFADACDDILSGVALLIREARQLRDTARVLHIRRALDYDAPLDLAHLPPLLDEEGRELSEHDARNSVAQLLREGFLPDAVINLLLSLGTEPPTELFTLPEAVEWFDLFALSPDPVRFNRARLRELNRRHLLRMDERTLSRIFRFADPDIGRLAKLYLNQAATIDELESRIGPIFAPKPCDGPDGELLRTLSALIVQGPYCRDYEELRRYLSQKSGIEGERLDRLLLRLFTGSDDGPSAAELYPHIKSYITEIARCQH